MMIAPSAFALPRPLRRPAIAIGNFDGVHRGHQALVSVALAAVKGEQRDAVALTFDPHPSSVVQPGAAPSLLMPLPRRLELLAELGLDATVVHPFDAAFSRLTAEEFARDVLAGALEASVVVVGSDFRFGAGRRGDPALLAALGATLGFEVRVVDKISVDGEVCSSSAIREHVRQGRVARAAQLLSRPFEVTGQVVAGQRRGRQLGFPTANLDQAPRLLPAEGVYAGRATLADGRSFVAAINVGRNPTFVERGARIVEAYLLDFEGDLYGQSLRLDFVERLRAELRFDSVDALVAQMHQDVAQTRSRVT